MYKLNFKTIHIKTHNTKKPVFDEVKALENFLLFYTSLFV